MSISIPSRAALGALSALVALAPACAELEPAGSPVGAEPQALAAATAPVQLVMYQNPGYGSHGSCGDAKVLVQVQNLAYEKHVTVHYRLPNSDTWADEPAYFVDALDGSAELWTASLDCRAPAGRTPELVVRYEVGGAVYWDDNGGANYHPAGPYGGLRSLLGSGTDVLLGFADFHVASPEGLRGGVYVRNLAYDKQVEVVYTTDGWQTYGVAQATYGFGTDVELWTFETEALPASEVELAIAYTVDGVTRWDSNAGRNYRLASGEWFRFTRER